MTARVEVATKSRVQGGQERLGLTLERRGMLAKVAIARKQLGLDEASYRDVVERITGDRSAAAASDAALHRLLAEFGRLGFKASPGMRRSNKPNVRLIYALWRDLAPYLREHTPDALRSFVRRQTQTPVHPDGLAAPEFLDGEQANRVIEALKAWLARARKGERA